MADQIVRTNDFEPANTQMQVWQEPRPEAPPAAKNPLERPLAAIRRYKWLVIAVILVATAGGIGATRLVKPIYEVQASILISSQNPMEERSGPIRGSGLFTADDWVQLLKSYSIVDAVARKLSLYLQPDDIGDKGLFRGFELGNRYVAGKYELVLNQTKKTWRLTTEASSAVADSGGMTDSVGRALGFHWVVPRAEFYMGKSERKVKFTVATPRETAAKLVSRISARRQGGESNFLDVAYDDPDPALAAQTINTWLEQYISVAADLKKQKLVDFSNTLQGQVQTSKAALDEAEVALSSFRVNTITEAHDPAPGPVVGIQQLTDPAEKAYFDLKAERDDVHRDIESLQRILSSDVKDSIPTGALLQIGTVARGAPAATALNAAIAELQKDESGLANALIVFTPENPEIKVRVAAITTLRKEKIPQLANDLLSSLKAREAELTPRIASSGVNLQKIPERTIEEEQLRRKRESAASIYSNLQARAAEAELAEASSTPDVKILDSAIAPLDPTSNSAWRLLAIAIAGGIGGALALAILLDKLDGKFRYAEQSTDDLGLPIAGTVPQFPKGGVDQRSTEQMFQLVESFRTLRMSILQSSTNGVSLAVSSPAPGEGKSLISANLAMSFADAGLRTVLVDGDTRRGTLHQMFGLPNAPGLTDRLAGSVDTAEVVLPTSNSALFLVPCGTRQGRSPELLTSPSLREMVAELRGEFDVVIFDTPPLAAGIDGYSIAAAAGSLVVVLRVGQTQRRMAAEKLRVLDRLPVDVVGSVLNGVDFRDGYEYYGYVPGYEAVDEPGTAVAQV